MKEVTRILIIAFDPGVTTGAAVWNGSEYYVHQIDSRDLTAVWNTLESLGDVVGYEDFKYRPRMTGVELYSKEVIGVIRLFCSIKGLSEPFKYLPSRAQAFWTDEKIKELGLWKPGQIHAMDALRVLLTHQGITDPEFNARVFKVLGETQSNQPQKDRQKSARPPKSNGLQIFLDPKDFE